MDSRIKIGLFFVRFFWCCLVSGGRDGSSGSKLRPAWERREEKHAGWGRGCHSSLQGELLAWDIVCPAHKSKIKTRLEEKMMRNGKWRKILLAIGIAFAVLMAVMTLWTRMHRNITAEDLAVRQIMREYDLSESEARWFVEWAEKVINME